MVLRVGGAGGAGGVAVSAGTNQASSGTVVFSNSNGVTFGQDTNGVVTASVAGTVAGGTANINFSAGTTSSGLSNIVFSNSNNLSFGLNGSTITVSFSQNNQAVSGSNGSYSFQTLSFSNANGISFGTSAGSAVTASYTVPTQTNQSVGIYASSQTTGQSSSSTVDARSISFVGQGGVSVGLSAGSVLISGATGGGAGGVAVSAGTQSVSTGTMVFSNSNNVTFGMSGSSQITASFSQSNQVNSVFAVSNTTQSTSGTINASALSFQGAGAVSVGVSNGSVIISAAAGAQSNQTLGVYALSNTTQSSSGTLDARSFSVNAYGMVSAGFSNGSMVISGPDTTAFNAQSVGMSTGGNTAGNTGFGTDRLVLAGGANITLSGSTNAGSMTISVVGGAGGGGGVALSAGTQSVSTGTVVYSNSNNITFGMSGSSQVTASYNFNLSAGTTSNNLNAVTFSNSNNVSFGINGSTVTASASFAAQTNQTVGLYALGNTTQNSSTTLDARTLSYNALGAMTWGYSNGSIQVSAPATSSLSATGMVSLSTNGSTISIGVPGQTQSRFDVLPLNLVSLSSSGQTNSAYTLQYIQQLNDALTFSRVDIPLNISLSSSGATNTAAIAISAMAVLYTRNGSTLSPVVGTSQSQTLSWASNTSNFSNLTGPRMFSFPLGTSIQNGDYWLGFYLSTSSGISTGANTTALNGTINMYLGTVLTASNFADVGSATNSTHGPIYQGLISSVPTNTSQTLQLSQLTVNGGSNFRANVPLILRNN